MKTIVIDGIDGTGKETQCKELKKNLEEKGFKVKLISFPDYQDNSSILVQRYLKGEYGEKPEEVNPYAAALFYSVDRLNFFLKEDLDNYDILICDRYTTSNFIHQATKIENEFERNKFISWLKDLEYLKLQLPEPDLVIYLELDSNISESLRKKRNKDKISDIHEADQIYLDQCNQRAQQIAQDQNWSIINCNKNDSIKSIEEIQNQILDLVIKEINE